MARRLKLDEELRRLLGTDYCYFQPPESLKLHYPCYVYSRESSDIDRADDLAYKKVPKYGLIYITLDPDDPLVDETEDHFSMCRLARSYEADGLNHFYYNLYY